MVLKSYINISLNVDGVDEIISPAMTACHPKFHKGSNPMHNIIIKILNLTLLYLSCITLAGCTRPSLPPPVILFDQGHGQRFLIENTEELDLSKLASVFSEQGFTVKSSNQLFTKELLTGISTLVISGPFKPISLSETTVIQRFLNDGGQLCVMLHIGFPVNDLLHSLGVAVSSGVIREQLNQHDKSKPKDFFVNNLAEHPITKNLEKINFYGAWALNTQLEANIIAKTSPSAWIDLNKNNTLEKGDAVQPFNVIVTGQMGHGHFMVFSDDAVFQNRFLANENHVLAVNLAKWLKEGSYY